VRLTRSWQLDGRCVRRTRVMPVGCVNAFMQLVGTREALHQGGLVGALGLAEPADQGRTGGWARRFQPKRSVGAVLVVVLDVDPQDPVGFRNLGRVR